MDNIAKSLGFTSMDIFKAGMKLVRGEYSQYTPTGKGFFVKQNAYFKTPRAGDWIYYFSRELGRVAHVGLVAEVMRNGNVFTIRVVEGNTSSAAYVRNGGMVLVKVYTFDLSQVGGGNRIDGFGRPFYSEDTCGVEDMLEVALKEVGYMEKQTPHDLESKEANAGNKNYTKYGAWYGNNGVYWCQQFMSWLAFKACEQNYEKRETGWKKADGHWFYLEKGKQVKDRWKYIKGRWYVFDGGGRMITGWFKSESGEYFYLNKDDGTMISGQWLVEDGEWYYLTDSGVMATDAYIASEGGVYSYVDAAGKWDKSKDTTSVESSMAEYV